MEMNTIPTVNQRVAGSSPAEGAKIHNQQAVKRRFTACFVFVTCRTTYTLHIKVKVHTKHSKWATGSIIDCLYTNMREN